MALPKMTPAERMARQAEKRQQLLSFLASGEGWTVPANAATLLGLSLDAAASTLNGMTRDRLLVREDIPAGTLAVLPIYGITATGIAACRSAPPTAREHRVGRVSPIATTHVLFVQRCRLAAARAGLTDWTPGRELRGRGLPVVPDATLSDMVALIALTEIPAIKRRREIIEAFQSGDPWPRTFIVIDAQRRGVSVERVRDLFIAANPAAASHRFEYLDIADLARGRWS